MTAVTADDTVAGGAFWRFSLALYARPGVARALIALQDRAGRDVNLMIFALWLGVQGRRLDGAALTVAENAIASLNAAAVGPLRRLRRQLRNASECDLAALRRRVAALELAAERQVGARLATLPLPPACPLAGDDRLTLADANLALYLGDMSAPEAAVLRAGLVALTRCVPRATVARPTP